MTKSTARPTWRNDYRWGFRVTDGGRIEPLTKSEAEAAVARAINQALKKVFGRRAMAAARRRLAKRGGS
jgi:hypothetical protein